jgi:nucleoside-diphosphate-sugar epimerase
MLNRKSPFVNVVLINIVITGGAGVIGSNFIFHILAKYLDISSALMS